MKKLIIISLLILSCLLLPACREAPEDNPDVITLTLGGFYISDEVQRAVVEFNHENNGAQITIRDYLDEIDGDWYAAQLRFRTEIVTGGGPDNNNYRFTFVP